MTDGVTMFDLNNFTIDKVLNFRFCWECPSCNGEYDLVENEQGVFVSPQLCPHCGFDIHKYNDQNKPKSPWRRVSKDEFYEFVKAYPNKLDFDTTGICDPPLSSYNDFTRGVWPESMVAKIYRNDMMPEEWNPGENEYYLREEFLRC